MLTLDHQKHPVHMPFVARARPSPPQPARIRLTKFATPLADRLVGHDHATFKHQLFDIPKAQAEPEVEPDGVADDFDREPMIRIFGSSWRYVLAATLPYRKHGQQVVNAFFSLTLSRDLVY